MTHAEGCRATLQAVICGNWVSNASWGTHDVYDAKNHYTVICTKTREIHLHTIRCANSSCGAVYETGDARACIEKHSYCTTVTGLCQY